MLPSGAQTQAPRPSRSTLLTAKLRNGALSTSILSRSLSRSARSLRLCSLWVVAAPIVLSQLGLSGARETLIDLARWPMLLGLVVLGLTTLYRYGPSLSDPQWTWLFPGNVIASVSWLILSGLFSWYIANFGNYDATYGSLGAAIGMMTWMWISMIVVLLGTELNAEIQRRPNAASSTS